MCGIAGYIGTQELSDTTLQSCLKRMHHRGPDHAASKRWNLGKNQLYFLHTRLSIIDLDPRANQPFQNGSHSLIFNGELYNYKELREELERAKIPLRTQSDTEVLSQLLAMQGIQALEKCEGMWSFADFNEKDRTLYLSRDRFGEKPLYLYKDATGLYFGSEIKFIAALLGKPLDINWPQLYRYWIHGYRSLHKTSASFFKDVVELPAGSWLRITADRKEDTGRYWNPTFIENKKMSYSDAVEGIRSRLLRAIEIRLRADVPLAFCMSGGVDSNTLISIAKRVFHYDVHGFTIENDDGRYREQDMVNSVVKDLGIRHTSIPLSTDHFLSQLRQLVSQHDAPVYTISYYAHWLLMKAIAQQGYRISVSGTGADELFSGYYDHHLFYLHEMHADPATYNEALQNWRQHVLPYIQNPFLKDPDRLHQNPALRDHFYPDKARFQQALKMPWDEPFTETSYSGNTLRNRMLNEMFHESIPVLLHEDDLNAMSFSIENRSPYLDRPLFEFANSIPTVLLIRDGYTKALLRDAVKEWVPAQVLTEHRKVGFNAPIFSFLDRKDPDVRDAVLQDSSIFHHIKREFIENLLDQPQLSNSESLFLFYFLSSKFFIENFETSGDSPAADCGRIQRKG